MEMRVKNTEGMKIRIMEHYPELMIWINRVWSQINVCDS